MFLNYCVFFLFSFLFQNGFVNCNKESCPFIEDCYLLDPKAADTCCKKCKGKVRAQA